VAAHCSALTCARGSTFRRLSCVESWDTSETIAAMTPRARQCPTRACERRSSDVTIGHPSPSGAAHRGRAASSREDEMPVTGRRGDRSSAVAFNAGSRGADDHGQAVELSAPPACREDSSIEGVLGWICCVSDALGRGASVDYGDAHSRRSPVLTPCCRRHGRLSIPRHREHVRIAAPAFRTLSLL
jgi:hypothetical protein